MGEVKLGDHDLVLLLVQFWLRVELDLGIVLFLYPFQLVASFFEQQLHNLGLEL